MKLGKMRLMWPVAGLIAAMIALASCKKPVAEEVVETPPPPVATPAAVVTTTPVPVRPVAALTPAPDPLAPPGIFFLLQKASITTEDGIVGLRPGQTLRQVAPGTYEVGGQTVQLRDDQVTNNLRIARQYATADATSQAALRHALQAANAPRATPSATTAANVASSATPVPRATPRPMTPAANLLSGGSRLGGGTGVADPETANRRNVRVDSSGRQYWKDSRGNIRYDF
jgi:hypothetical protein